MLCAAVRGRAEAGSAQRAHRLLQHARDPEEGRPVLIAKLLLIVVVVLVILFAIWGNLRRWWRTKVARNGRRPH